MSHLHENSKLMKSSKEVWFLAIHQLIPSRMHCGQPIFNLLENSVVRVVPVLVRVRYLYLVLPGTTQYNDSTTASLLE